jgi:hypothetical protein
MSAKISPIKDSAGKTSSAQDSQFDEWALLDLFGHQRIAGRVRNASIGGGSFIRLDVPAIGEQEALTRFISPNAVYSITPMSEKTVRTLIKSGLRCEPISRYDVSKLLPAAREEYGDGV